MTRQTQTTGQGEQQSTWRDVSTSVAHVDVAMLLGTGLVAVLVSTAGRRARTATPLVATGGSLATALAVALRLGRRSGVTATELRRALPGDDLIPHPRLVSDRALTIHAAAEDVWPWLVQMGYQRGGWYTNQRLDKLIWHIDNPSADRIIPELQRLQVGDIVPDGPPGTACFQVAALEPGRALVLLDAGGTHVPGTAFSWAFVLEPGADSETRLQVRTRGAYPPRLLMTLVARLVVGPADCVMVSGQMLRGIKRRAERSASGDALTRRSRRWARPE